MPRPFIPNLIPFIPYMIPFLHYLYCISIQRLLLCDRNQCKKLRFLIYHFIFWGYGRVTGLLFHFCINKEEPYPSKALFSPEMYPGRESNPHGLNGHRILSPACLPIPPPGQNWKCKNTIKIEI